MKKLFIIAALGLWIASCAKTECTTADRSQWQDEETFKQNLIEQGYKIEEFKVTDGNCYEIYGWDKDKHKVEIYFNPVDGSKIKEEVR